jgi:drug/metabolite transporter (DMT)-like permease
MLDDPAARRHAHRGEVYAALAAGGFGSAYVATAFALRSFGPVPIAFWRGLFAAVALQLVIAVRARRSPADWTTDSTAGEVRSVARLARLGVLSILGGPLFFVAMNLSISHVGATVASFVAGLYAILAALFAPFVLPERPTTRIVAAFVVALAGTALLAELDFGSSDVAGLAWGLTAAVSYALYLVLTRRWSSANRLDGKTIAAATTTSTAVCLGVPLLLADPGQLLPVSIAPEAAIAIAWLSAVAALGQVLVVASVRLMPAARSAAFLLLNPVTATVLSALLLGAFPSMLQLLGGALVLAGIAAATLPAWRKPGPSGARAGRSAG